MFWVHGGVVLCHAQPETVGCKQVDVDTSVGAKQDPNAAPQSTQQCTPDPHQTADMWP